MRIRVKKRTRKSKQLLRILLAQKSDKCRPLGWVFDLVGDADRGTALRSDDGIDILRGQPRAGAKSKTVNRMPGSRSAYAELSRSYGFGGKANT